MAKKSPTGSNRQRRRKPQVRRPYKQGDWIVVPLRPSGYAVGCLARAPRSGVLLGYFFGPKRDVPPDLQEVENLQPSEALCCFRFSDMGILEGEWSVLGQSKPWDPDFWPVPIFVRRDFFTQKPEALIQYEEDMLHYGKFPVDKRDVSSLPEDELLGDKAVEIDLSMRFGWTPEAE